MTTEAAKLAERPLPDGWQRTRLGDVCERAAATDPRKEPERRITYVDISSIDRVTKRIVNPKSILGRDAPPRARRLIHENDVLVATTRPNLNAVAMVPSHLDGQVASTGICVLRPSASLNPEYLFHYTKSREFVVSLSDLVRGALYPAVTDAQVLSQSIPLPPVAEQKRIAELLNEQMAAVEKAKKATREGIAAIDAIPSALLRRAFSGAL